MIVLKDFAEQKHDKVIVNVYFFVKKMVIFTYTYYFATLDDS